MSTRRRVAAVGGRGERRPAAQPRGRQVLGLLDVLDGQGDARGQPIGQGLGVERLDGRDRRLDGRRDEVDAEARRRVERAEGGDGGGDGLGRIDVAAVVPGHDGELATLVAGHDRGIGRRPVEASREGREAVGGALGVEGDPRAEAHPAQGGAGVGDDPLDGVAGTTDGHGLVDHRVDVGPAAQLGVGDRRSARPARPARARPRDRPAYGLEARRGGRGRSSPDRSTAPTRHPGQDPADVLAGRRSACAPTPRTNATTSPTRRPRTKRSAAGTAARLSTGRAMVSGVVVVMGATS